MRVCGARFSLSDNAKKHKNRLKNRKKSIFFEIFLLFFFVLCVVVCVVQQSVKDVNQALVDDGYD
jgi:hypothetical protein